MNRATEDPLLRNSRREAFILFGVWAVCLVYTSSYCYLNGYVAHEADPSASGLDVADFVRISDDFNRSPDRLAMPLGLGIPDWVFYGIVVPWLACIVFTFWFMLFVYQEDDLGDSVTQSDAADDPSNSEGGDA